MPTLILVPDQQLNVTGPTTYIRWLTPVDDDHHALFHVMRVPPGVEGTDMFARSSRPMPMGNKTMWSEMTEDEHQIFPTDWEAMCSLGRVGEHVDENLGTTDQGIVMLRKLLKEQIDIVRNGGDPVGVTFSADHARHKTDAGNYFRSPEGSVPAG
jgi:hypothetical protein